MRPAVAIERPAVRGATAVRRAAAQPHADQQRTLEPAAILVAAFQIEIGRPAQPVLFVQRREMARAGIEPDIENVVLFGEFRCPALRARRSRREPVPPRFARTRYRPNAARTDPPRYRESCDPSAARGTARNRKQQSARPRRAGARCTNRGGWRPCWRCALRPTRASS